MDEIAGGLFTACTVSTKVSLVLLVPSLTVTVMVALPDWLVVGSTLTVRFDPLPPKVMFWLGTSAGLEEVPLRVSVLAALSTSPMVKGTGPAGGFCVGPGLTISEINGASFTGFTVTVKVRLIMLLLGCPSLTRTVITAVPLASGAEAKVTLPVLAGLV